MRCINQRQFLGLSAPFPLPPARKDFIFVLSSSFLLQACSDLSQIWAEGTA